MDFAIGSNKSSGLKLACLLLRRAGVMLMCKENTESFLTANQYKGTTKNPVYHSCTKHITIKCHFIREVIEVGEIII